MVTVLRADSLRVVIYPNDHRHVHVIKAGHEAVFNLHCPQGPPELRENYGFPERELRSVRSLLTAHLPKLCEQWSEIHGTP